MDRNKSLKQQQPTALGRERQKQQAGQARGPPLLEGRGQPAGSHSPPLGEGTGLAGTSPLPPRGPAALSQGSAGPPGEGLGPRWGALAGLQTFLGIGLQQAKAGGRLPNASFCPGFRPTTVLLLLAQYPPTVNTRALPPTCVHTPHRTLWVDSSSSLGLMQWVGQASGRFQDPLHTDTPPPPKTGSVLCVLMDSTIAWVALRSFLQDGKQQRGSHSLGHSLPTSCA